MGLQAPPTQRHDVQILTTHFQFNGQLETVGPAENYINTPTRDSLALYDLYAAPLTPGIPLKGASRSDAVVLRSQIVFLYFTSAETRSTISTFPRRELLVVYTPVAVCRGYFHMPAEANLRDLLGAIPTSLIPITEAHVFPYFQLPAPFPAQAEMILAGRSQILFYHEA
ncbi:MAG: hypothetical protein DRI48_05600 [Chloroflexi bacterium]|nr:MAG: hypothetical protein DRI48_05600 [Chloroflexota bacterium]